MSVTRKTCIFFFFLVGRTATITDSETAKGTAADSGLNEEVEKRNIHPLFGSHFLYKRLLRLPYQRRQDSRFTHSFVGKRSGDSDGDSYYENLLGEEEDKRAPAFSHRFVGKRAPAFAHRFVGKRQPSFSHRFVGKRTPDGLEIQDDSPLSQQVEKRAPSFNHKFVGKRAPTFSHSFIGKRAPSKFQHRFVGKRAPAFSHRFVGKRFPEDEAALLQYLNAEDEDQDSYDFAHSIRKRDTSSDQIEIDERAPAFSHRFVGKRVPVGLSERSAYEHRYLGKREDEQEQQDEQLEQQDVESLAEML